MDSEVDLRNPWARGGEETVVCSFISDSPSGSFCWRRESKRGTFQAEEAAWAKILRQKCAERVSGLNQTGPQPAAEGDALHKMLGREAGPWSHKNIWPRQGVNYSKGIRKPLYIVSRGWEDTIYNLKRPIWLLYGRLQCVLNVVMREKEELRAERVRLVKKIWSCISC